MGLLALVVAALPWGALRPLGAVLGLLAGSLLRIRRAHVEASMTRAQVAVPPRTARAMYASLGTGLLELLWLSGRPRAGLAGKVRFAPDALAALERCRAMGRGVVVASAHTGNWDLVACATAEALGPLAVVTKRLSMGRLDRFWQRTRARRGLRLVDAAGAAAEVRGALARRELAAMMIDQAPERRGGVVDAAFLGERASCDLVPALLASRGRAPILLALGRRLADGTHLVEVPLVLEPPAHASRAWAVEATSRLQAALDAFVRAHPDQWLWLHRRWKAAPAGRGAAGVAERGLTAGARV